MKLLVLENVTNILVSIGKFYLHAGQRRIHNYEIAFAAVFQFQAQLD